MRSRKWMITVNWMMLISLIVVFATGILLKVMPGMWMGISHALSGLLLVISAAIHMVQHGMLSKKSR